jgi:putative RNA 2'-phosphotransferase
MRRSDTKISKFLSLVLRHKPDIIGLQLDESGWATITELIVKSRSAGVVLTEALIQQVVAGSDKQRFAISGDGTRIRANQGHSIPVDMSGQEAVPPEVLYHGTARSTISAILQQGIKRGNRLYVHLSSDIETARCVGQRHGHPVVVVVQAGNMHKDGFRFYLSENGVWLTEFVPSEYILKNYSQ